MEGEVGKGEEGEAEGCPVYNSFNWFRFYLKFGFPQISAWMSFRFYQNISILMPTSNFSAQCSWSFSWYREETSNTRWVSARVKVKVPLQVSILARLLSLALGVNSVAILNFGGVWVTQATPTSTHSLSVANHLVQDYIVTQPGLCSTLKHLPTQSPLFTANLIASIGELHSRVGGEGGEFSPAPKQVVSLVTSWLRSSPSLCDSSSPSLPVTGTSPISSLLAWPVLAPLVGREEEGQALLHHTLVETILSESGQCQVPGQYLTHLARSLHSRLSEGNHSEQAQGLALDRYHNWATFLYSLEMLLFSVNSCLFQVWSNFGGSYKTKWGPSSWQRACDSGQRSAKESPAHHRSVLLYLVEPCS